MNKILQLIIAIPLIFFSSFELTAQSLHSNDTQLLLALEDDHPALPATYRQTLTQTDSQWVEALFRCGEGARLLHIFNLAETCYGLIPDAFKTGLYSVADFHLANIKKGKGKYAEAAAHYKIYLEKQSGTAFKLVKIAEKELVYNTWVAEMLMKPALVEITHLGNNVNTIYSDLAPLRYADKLYFTSTVTDAKSGPVQRIFSVIKDNPAIVVAENTSETSLHSANITLTVDARRMYYTICQNTGTAGSLLCDIYYRDKSYEGFWGNAKKLPRYINLEGYSATQPSVGIDKNTGKELLFFASDRPGGKGKMDIWCSVIDKDNNFGQPFPLPFNTPEDDITPFFHTASKTLFFSSEGLQNLGGFDIFRVEKTGSDSWAAPVNMGFPINTTYDDYYYTFHSTSKRGYFSSNRPGALCHEGLKERQCTDIYEAKINVNLSLGMFSAADSSELADVKVELLNLSSKKVDTFFVNPSGNHFTIPLDLEKTYRLSASHPKFRSASLDVNTLGINYFTTIENKLYLRSGAELVIRTFNGFDNTLLNGVSVTLNEDKTGQVIAQQSGWEKTGRRFSLDFGKKYTVSVSKPGYSSASAEISTLNLSNTDTTIYLDLRLKPFQGLPLVLYFDNDQPKYENWTDTTTTLTYEQTCRSYLLRKNEFLKGFTRGLSWAEKSKAGTAIQAFFKDSIEGNLNKLESYGDVLEDYLKSGQRIEMLVAGFASPLASADYNKRLTSRRISSVVNYFKKYKDGVFLPYFANGQLVISKDPRGEEIDFKNVSDDSVNRRSSVFSPAASKLRKVMITEIRPLVSN